MKTLLVIILFTCAGKSILAQVKLITTIAGNDTAGFCCDGEISTKAKLNNPNKICLDKLGNLYIADPGNNRIRKIALSTGIISTVAGNGLYGYSGDNILATNSSLWIPDGVTIDTFGNIYIADGENHRIRKVTVATGIITTIVGAGIAGYSGDGGLASSAKISGPTGLSIDRNGNLYFADIDFNIIRKVTPDGIITTVAGNGHIGYSGDGGPATLAQMNTPDIAKVDNFGNIILVDSHNNILRKIIVATGVIITIAGNGLAAYTGDGGPATNAKLNDPFGLFIDKQNNIFFAEYGNGTIRRIDGNTGIISTVAGNGTPGFSGDGGPATNAQLIPEDLTIDDNGIMYVADYENNRIRIVYSDKLSISSIIRQSEAIKISPNPAQDELTIENAIGRFFCIYNMIGREVYRGKIVTDKETLPIKGFPVGLYLAEFTDEKGLKQTIRFVKNE